MDKSDYFKVVEENQNLKKTIEFQEKQEMSLRKELLKERQWRISFQLDYLKGLSERTREELEQLEKGNGDQAESPIHSQG